MWYFLIFIGVLVMLFCYRLSRMRRRPRGAMRRFASQTATILAGCIALMAIIGMIQFSSAGKSQQRQALLQNELAYRRAMGQVLAKETLTKFDRAKGVIFMAPKPASDTERAYVNAILDGIKATAGQLPVMEIELEAVVTGNADMERLLTSRRMISIAEMDNAVRKNPDYNVLICLSNVPADYSGSGFAIRVARGDLRIGYIVNDIYMLGDEIANRQISACVVPKRALAFPRMTVPTETIEAFNERYSILTEGNVGRFALDNRRMMHIARSAN